MRVLTDVEHEACDQEASDVMTAASRPAAAARMAGVLSLERTTGALTMNPVRLIETTATMAYGVIGDFFAEYTVGQPGAVL
jgi:hypothetical protein